MTPYHRKLKDGYEIRSVPDTVFEELWKEPAKTFFEDSTQLFRSRDFLTDEENNQFHLLRLRMQGAYRQNLGVFLEDEFVGWSWGFQESGETFYMCNSAIMPEHRRKGLYTELLKSMLEVVTKEGFQKIYSRHVATNNAVLIPKLKAGFQITNLEMSDVFGVLVHLTYFPNPMRRKMLAYRSGQLRPDSEIRRWLRLDRDSTEG